MTGETQVANLQPSSAHEEAIETMLSDRLDQFELGLSNLAAATKRRFDRLQSKLAAVDSKLDKVLAVLRGVES